MLSPEKKKNEKKLEEASRVIYWRVLTTKLLKFIYSEKATKCCKISPVDLSYVVPVKSTVEISQNFVAFSKYMNFRR